MVYRLMHIFIFILLTSVLMSCTTIYYESTGIVPVQISKDPKHKDAFNTTGNLNFYLWGVFPDNHVIKIDQIAYDNGFDSVSYIEIKEKTSWTDLLVGLFTLGLKTQRTYQISGYGKKRITKIHQQ